MIGPGLSIYRINPEIIISITATGSATKTSEKSMTLFIIGLHTTSDYLDAEQYGFYF